LEREEAPHVIEPDERAHEPVAPRQGKLRPFGLNGKRFPEIKKRFRKFFQETLEGIKKEGRGFIEKNGDGLVLEFGR